MVYRYYSNNELSSADFGITILYIVVNPLNVTQCAFLILVRTFHHQFHVH
jgi:hypothetical protein